MIADKYQDELEEKQHEEAISRLCQEYPEQKELIRRQYFENLDPLITDARIRTYLPIFVSRKVKTVLQGLPYRGHSQ